MFIVAQIATDIQTLGIAAMATIMILREVEKILNNRKEIANNAPKTGEVKEAIDSALHHQAVLDRLLSILKWQEQTGIIMNRIEQQYSQFVREGCPNARSAEDALNKIEKVADSILNRSE